MSSNERILSVLGVVAYLAVGVLFLAAGLMVPEPWVFFLWAVWLAGWLVVYRVYRAAPKWTPLVAVGAAAFWVAILQLGEIFLGWTA